MKISRIERVIGPKDMGHVQRVTHEFKDGKLIQTGETIEHGQTIFKEVIEKGWNYFKRSFESYSEGKPIKGSQFVEEVFGDDANKKPIRKFGIVG